MAYTEPAGDNVEFDFTEEGYTPPAGDSVEFNFKEYETYTTIEPIGDIATI